MSSYELFRQALYQLPDYDNLHVGLGSSSEEHGCFVSISCHLLNGKKIFRKEFRDDYLDGLTDSEAIELAMEEYMLLINRVNFSK